MNENIPRNIGRYHEGLLPSRKGSKEGNISYQVKEISLQGAGLDK